MTTKRVNDNIRVKKVKLVGDGFNGEIVEFREALRIANEMKLDLVQMSDADNSGVAVCKVMDYGKYIYSQEKKAKANKKHRQDTKEIRLSDTIADNDIKTKARHTDKLLRDGDNIIVSIVYRGRQIAYLEHGFSVLNKFKSYLSESYQEFKSPRVEGNRVYMVLRAVSK